MSSVYSYSYHSYSYQQADELVIKSYTFALIKNLKWPYQVEITLSQIGMMDSIITKENNSHIKVFQRLYDIFHQKAFDEISRDSSKLRTYSLVKRKIGLEGYLSSNTNINTQNRIALTKFRLSNHDLMIEKGKHIKLDKAERFCPCCPTLVETEMHFLLHCKTFLCMRTELLAAIMLSEPSFNSLSDDDKFIYLLNNEYAFKYTSTCIRKGFQCRTFLLEKHKNNV